MTGTIKDYTPNFSLIIPEFNITGWHDYIEEDLRSIDALLYNIFDIQNYSGRWLRLTTYTEGQVVFIDDATDRSFMGKMYKVLSDHTTTDEPFDEFYEANPTYYERFLDASSAQQYANYCKLYAEGTDEQVSSLDITHSCKKWNELCENVAQTAQNYATQAQLSAESAEDFLEQMQNTGYGADLSLSNNTLQLLDQNGDALGNPVTIDAGGDYKGVWDATKNYKVGDIVAYNPQSTYQNIFYMCYQDNPVSAPTGMGWSRITEDHLVTVEPRQDNNEYRLGLIDVSITQRYQTDLRFSVNAPKVNAQTGEIVGYATKTYVDNAVGSIETLLHNINTGE